MALVCYHGDNPHVIDQKRADFIIEIVADPECRKIIASIKDEFKNAHQISRETKLSVNKVYNKIHKMAEKTRSSHQHELLHMEEKSLSTKARFVR